MKLVLFFLLLVLCWPAALALLVLYPVLWLILLPLRLLGLVVHGAFDVIAAVFLLPSKLLKAL